MIMHRELVIAAVASLLSAYGASAQVNPHPSVAPPAAAPAPPAGPAAAPSAPATTPPLPNAPPAASVNPPTTAGLKSGMVVKDGTGATVGTIAQVGQTADGRPAVMIDVDGKQIGMLASNLSLGQGGAEAVSTMTKAQLQASAAQKPG
jgi:hypothetical protein